MRKTSSKCFEHRQSLIANNSPVEWAEDAGQIFGENLNGGVPECGAREQVDVEEDGVLREREVHHQQAHRVHQEVRVPLRVLRDVRERDVCRAVLHHRHEELEDRERHSGHNVVERDAQERHSRRSAAARAFARFRGRRRRGG